jgi:Family of unknown function (DUF6893)
MTYIRVPVPLVVAGALVAVAAAVGAQVPEIQRYLKVKAM